MKLYIVAHKRFDPPALRGYEPIQVGRAFSGQDLGYLSDDTKDNIADKNKFYCELTAHYWVWKNDKSDEPVGFCHYRRYFTRNGFSANKRYFLREKQVEKILKKYDIILPEKVYLQHTVQEKYSLTGGGFQKDLDSLRTLLQAEYADYLEAYDFVMGQNGQYFWNMFVMKREIFQQYSEWLFGLLKKYEPLVSMEGYNDRQKRIYGYLSERLLNVWVLRHRFKIFECPVVQTDKSAWNIFKTQLSVLFKKPRY